MPETQERQQTEYLSCAETAKLVRVQLKKQFPGVKFSVRSSTYSMGASIYVGWTDGPTEAQVREVTQQFASGRFDGMIDYGWTVSSWLKPDGTAIVAYDSGSGYTGGMNSPVENEAPEGARLVHFGAHYISGSRELSEAFKEKIAKANGLDRAELDKVDAYEYERRVQQLSGQTSR